MYCIAMSCTTTSRDVQKFVGQPASNPSCTVSALPIPPNWCPTKHLLHWIMRITMMTTMMMTTGMTMMITMMTTAKTMMTKMMTMILILMTTTMMLVTRTTMTMMMSFQVCNLWHKSGVRYMRTCQTCPSIYPWTSR